MAFTFGRGKTIGRWLRVRPRVFLDWEKTEGVLPPELCNQHKHEEGTPMLLEPATARNVSRFSITADGQDFQKTVSISGGSNAEAAAKDLVEKIAEQMSQVPLKQSRIVAVKWID
jgi:hypothetical protein